MERAYGLVSWEMVAVGDTRDGLAMWLSVWRDICITVANYLNEVGMLMRDVKIKREISKD